MLLFFAFFLPVLAQATYQFRRVNLATTGVDPPLDPHVSVKQFDQLRDHFAPDLSTFHQKYWVNDKYYRPGGPVFIMLGGEGPTSAFWIQGDDNGLPDYLKNARIFGALAIQLEHRFYGDSYPTEDMSTPNLRYLSSRQALADAATFVEALKSNQLHIAHDLSTAKVISFGGSYSGALSAWLRLKYPHLIDGAIATSGPVFAKYDFKEYLGVVQHSLSVFNQTCNTDIKAATDELYKALKEPDETKGLKDKLHLCENINVTVEKDVANLFSGVMGNFMGAVQYNRDNRGLFYNKWTIEKLCDIFLTRTTETPLTRYGDVVKYINGLQSQTCLEVRYDSMISELRQTENSPNQAGRLWTYQTCTEFGYFQSTDLPTQPFGHSVPVTFFSDMCVDVFGPTFNATSIQKFINLTNSYYGGRNLQQSNIVLPNGSTDPWHALGILQSSDPRRPAIFINGTAHCADMYPPVATDSKELQQARKIITQYLGSWLYA